MQISCILRHGRSHSLTIIIIAGTAQRYLLPRGGGVGLQERPHPPRKVNQDPYLDPSRPLRTPLKPEKLKETTSFDAAFAVSLLLILL